jgi:hypothetical protein
MFDKSNVQATSVQLNDSMLHLPSAEAAGSRRSVPCAIAEIHGHYLRIVTSEPVKAGAAISVEGADAMFLGEVVRSSEEEGRWKLDIRVEQVLNGLMSLMALRARLLDGATQAAPVRQATAVREPAVAAQVHQRSFA